MGRLNARVEKLEGIRARRDTLADLSGAELERRIADVRLRLIELGADPDTLIAEWESTGRATPGIGARVRGLPLSLQ